MSKEQVLSLHEEYQSWLNSLVEILGEKAEQPYTEGKWSPKEIIIHLAEWDRFTLEERLPLMLKGAQIEGFPEFQQFNDDAALKARNYSFEEAIEYAKLQRQLITNKLRTLADETWCVEFTIGKHVRTISSYFLGFAEHDAHHRKQIETIK